MKVHWKRKRLKLRPPMLLRDDYYHHFSSSNTWTSSLSASLFSIQLLLFTAQKWWWLSENFLLHTCTPSHTGYFTTLTGHYFDHNQQIKLLFLLISFGVVFSLYVHFGKLSALYWKCKSQPLQEMTVLINQSDTMANIEEAALSPFLCDLLLKNLWNAMQSIEAMYHLN